MDVFIILFISLVIFLVFIVIISLRKHAEQIIPIRTETITQPETTTTQPKTTQPIQTDIPANDAELMRLVNQHRVKMKLSEIPISKDAWKVASTHNYDLSVNKPWSGQGQSGCSSHSWSNQPGKWTGCCYNLSNPNGPCMWNKPYEITGNKLKGYEIGSGGGGNRGPQQALDMWLASAPHRAVIENSGIWANMKWAGLGCSLENNQQGCWFLA